MTFKQTMSLLFSTAEGTYYKWKSQKRPIIQLLDYLLTQSEIEEFLSSPDHKIAKFEMIKNQEVVFKYSRDKYLSIFINPLGSVGNATNKDFMDFYFNVLVFAKNKIEDQAIFEPFDIQRSSLLYSTRIILLIRLQRMKLFQNLK